MEVSNEILNDIADSMEAGFKCFLHRDTHEVVSYLDPDQYLETNLKDWKEEIDKVRKNKRKFIEIESMTSSDNFKVMQQFAYSVEDNRTKIRFVTALEGRHPFANFKHQVDNSGEYREQWFDFRRQRNIDWIKQQLSVVPH